MLGESLHVPLDYDYLYPYSCNENLWIFLEYCARAFSCSFWSSESLSEKDSHGNAVSL